MTEECHLDGVNRSVNDAHSNCSGHCLSAVVHTELEVDALQPSADRPFAEVTLLRQINDGSASCNGPKQVDFLLVEIRRRLDPADEKSDGVGGLVWQKNLSVECCLYDVRRDRARGVERHDAVCACGEGSHEVVENEAREDRNHKSSIGHQGVSEFGPPVLGVTTNEGDVLHGARKAPFGESPFDRLGIRAGASNKGECHVRTLLGASCMRSRVRQSGRGRHVAAPGQSRRGQAADIASCS